MRKLLTILIIMATMMLTSSCQKELPDAIKNVDVSQGEKTPTSSNNVDVSQGGQTPTPTPIQDNPTDQDDIPTEDDNPWPGY